MAKYQTILTICLSQAYFDQSDQQIRASWCILLISKASQGTNENIITNKKNIASVLQTIICQLNLQWRLLYNTKKHRQNSVQFNLCSANSLYIEILYNMKYKKYIVSSVKYQRESSQKDVPCQKHLAMVGGQNFLLTGLKKYVQVVFYVMLNKPFSKKPI